MTSMVSTSPEEVITAAIGSLIGIKYSGEYTIFKLLGYDPTANLITVETTTDNKDILIIPLTSIISISIGA